MRYQERIYIQNEHSGVRNNDILNVNMSSDMCVFETPLFNLSGASKLDCSGATGTSYVITTATTIPLTFNFTAHTNSFTANNATFKYEIYKYDSVGEIFALPPIYTSTTLNYSGFSATSATTQLIPISGLSLDGEYLVKGFYVFDACTDFLYRLGKRVDTLTYRSGSSYGLYDSDLDYYFIAMTAAETPFLLHNGSNTPPANQLYQQVIMPPSGETTFVITNSNNGFFVVTLNGLVLAPNLDYTFTGSVITLSGETVFDDIITIIYTTNGGNSIVGNNIQVTSPVVSGVTNAQGTNNPYFNTTTGKFEIYTEVTPVLGGALLVMINGVTLANGIDYYISTSNPNRIILEGDIVVDDIITMVYYPMTNAINGLITNLPVIVWGVNNAPQLENGYFTLEVSTGSTFSDYYFTGNTDYIVGNGLYSDTFTAIGPLGMILYYRVKNVKNYITICGDIVTSIAYSETIPLIIQTNSINSY